MGPGTASVLACRYASHLAERLQDGLATFVEADGRAELFVGWFLAGNSGAALGWKLLDRLAKCRLALSLDVYPPNLLRSNLREAAQASA